MGHPWNSRHGRPMMRDYCYDIPGILQGASRSGRIRPRHSLTRKNITECEQGRRGARATARSSDRAIERVALIEQASRLSLLTSIGVPVYQDYNYPSLH